jgi:hypothetical protein
MLRFHPRLLSRHAWREARRERIPIAMIALTYDDPDHSRPSDHDPDRLVLSRWLGDHGLAVVVDLSDARVVTVWRIGWKP